jgi:hydrogenase maturation protease
MTTRRSNTLLIGVGNSYRSDDGVGIAVVRRIGKQAPAGVSILEASGEGAALLDAWGEATAVVLVDAVQSGAPPGTIHRLDAAARPIPSRFFHTSTHSFSVAEAIELARALNRLPSRLIVYGIEGKDFSAGDSLSAEVEKASETAATQVLEEVRALAKGGAICTSSL